MKKRLAWLFMSIMLIGSLCAAMPTATVQAASNAKFVEQEGKAGIVTSYPIDISYPSGSSYVPHKVYYAACSAVNYFFDYKGYFNVVYVKGADSAIIIERYDANMKKVDSITLADDKYGIYGRTICDDKGNYYVVEGGREPALGTYSDILGIYKYDYYGNLLGVCHLDGYETSLTPDTEEPEIANNGAKDIFAAGTCEMAINNGILAVHFSQQMYNGHQRSNIVYIDCETMEQQYDKITLPLYVSHSFDQEIITTSDGNYLAVNHGDASPERAFYISKVDANGNIIPLNEDAYEGSSYLNECEGISTFHFREGPNRDKGYNETFAQLGGIVELDNSYALFASSERTLSLEYAYTREDGSNACVHNEARDLFLQYLNKDFLNLPAEDRYVAAGETRTTVGTHPQRDVGELMQDEDAKDYGVIWLTDYPDDYYAGNPQMVEIDNNRLLLLWEKHSYNSNHDAVTYYAIVDANGDVIRQPVALPGVELTGNTAPVYKDGKVYWATNEVDDDYYVNLKKDYIHVLDIYATPKNWTLLTDLTPKTEYVYVKPGESFSLKDYVQKVPADASTDDFSYVLVNANPSVNSTVDKNGMFTMGDAYCTEEIHIYSNENQSIGTMFYIVADAPYETGIMLDKKSFYTTMNHSGSLSVTGFASEALGDAHNDVKYGDLIWTSSDENIATIEVKGNFDKRVTLHFHSLGDVTVTVTESRSGVSASCEIEVISVEEYNQRMDDEYNAAIGGGTDNSGGNSSTGGNGNGGTSGGNSGNGGSGTGNKGDGGYNDNINGGTSDVTYTGIEWAEDGNLYLYENGVVNTSYSGLYNDTYYGWCLVLEGKLAVDYEGLYCDADYGWYFICGGIVDFDYTGLYCDANYGWWLIKEGSVAFDYAGLWCDDRYGWWLVNGGAVNFGYTGLYCDANYGWWLIGGGAVAFDYTGLWGDSTYGWWLVNGGSVNFGYTGLYCDANYGWWLIGGGAVAFDYNGLWGDPVYGWWLVNGGSVNFGYTGLYYDANYGWWYIQGGSVGFGYTGEVYYNGVPYYVVNGQLV